MSGKWCPPRTTLQLVRYGISHVLHKKFHIPSARWHFGCMELCNILQENCSQNFERAEVGLIRHTSRQKCASIVTNNNVNILTMVLLFKRNREEDFWVATRVWSKSRKSKGVRLIIKINREWIRAGVIMHISCWHDQSWNSWVHMDEAALDRHGQSVRFRLSHYFHGFGSCHRRTHVYNQLSIVVKASIKTKYATTARIFPSKPTPLLLRSPVSHSFASFSLQRWFTWTWHHPTPRGRCIHTAKYDILPVMVH